MMVKRICVLCLCLLTPGIAAAGSIVSWQAVGEIGFSLYAGFPDTGRVPPPGTPFVLTLQFDPASMAPTVLAPAGSNCNSVAVDASISLDGYDFGMSGLGFTHARLPGTNCAPGTPETQFILGIHDAPVGNPWPVLAFGFMEVWYTDALVRDAFPNVPTMLSPGGFQIRDSSGSFIVSGRADLQAVTLPEQPSPVPEPGTMTLFGLGLAAVARRIRKRSREQAA